MKNNNVSPAFPMGLLFDKKKIDGTGGYEKETAQYWGLTKREYYAGLAPDNIPDWFNHKQTDKPKEPNSWMELSADNPFRNELKNWHHDPTYDLPEELAWYQTKWAEHWEKKRLWELEDKTARYFQWRIYYADALLAELEK